jgi:hypothetical protein
MSASTDSRSIESIILLPNTARCATLNFIAMWKLSQTTP